MLPEDLCRKLTVLAEQQSRTISNMAKVLIQEGVNRHANQSFSPVATDSSLTSTEGFRHALEAQEPKRLRGAPRRLRFSRPS